MEQHSTSRTTDRCRTGFAALLFAAAAITPLAGCGGDSAAPIASSPPPGPSVPAVPDPPGPGTPSPTPTPPTPAPPPDPPPTPAPPPAFALLSSLPSDRAGDVAREASLLATFSNPVAPTTANASTVRLTGPNGVAIPVNVAVNGASLQISPAAGAVPGLTTYTWRIDGALLDTYGQALGTAVSRSFTTVAQAWAARATDVVPLSEYQSYLPPAAVVDDAGVITLMWPERVGRLDNLQSARRDPLTGAWSATTTIRPAVASLVQYRLEFDPTTGPYAVWNEDLAGEIVAQMAHFSASTGAWSAPVRLRAIPDQQSLMGVRVAFDATGDLTVLALSGNRQLFASRRNAKTGNWTEPESIEIPSLGGTIFAFDLVVNQRGLVTAAWTQSDPSGRRQIYSRQFDPSTGTWGAARMIVDFGVVSASSGNVFSIATAADDVVAIAWERDGGIVGELTVEGSRLDPATGNWLPPQRLDAATNGAFRPRLFVGKDGTATAVWQQRSEVFSSRLPRTESAWSPAVQLASGSLFADTRRAIVSDPFGNLTLLYETTDRQAGALHYRAGDQTWQPAGAPISLPASGTPFFMTSPALLVDRAGTVSVLWSAYRSVAGNPDYAICINRFK